MTARLTAAMVMGLALAAPAAAQAPPSASQPAAAPAAAAFARLKALAGEWVDVDGVFGEKGKVAVTYKVAGGGHTVIESFPVGTPYEMVTVYHLDGESVALTHYCTSNTQPRMRASGLDGQSLTFEFAGGTNIDPGHTSHMHSARIEFLGPDEIRSAWQNWKDGRPDGPAHPFRVVRRR